MIGGAGFCPSTVCHVFGNAVISTRRSIGFGNSSVFVRACETLERMAMACIASWRFKKNNNVSEGFNDVKMFN